MTCLLTHNILSCHLSVHLASLTHFRRQKAQKLAAKQDCVTFEIINITNQGMVQEAERS